MADLSGVIPLQPGDIDQTITRTAPGVYVIGTYAGDRRQVAVHTVGRSDDDLSATLKLHVSRPDWLFQYEYTETAEAAYQLECQLFHEHEPTLIAPSHPAKTRRVFQEPWQCPVCQV
jgi:hypothetical protein